MNYILNFDANQSLLSVYTHFHNMNCNPDLGVCLVISIIDIFSNFI